MHSSDLPALAVALALLAPSAAAQGPLLKAPRYFEEWPGEARLAGDFDADGDVDLVRFEGSSSSGVWTAFTVLLNDGSGRLAPGATNALPAGCAERVLLADLDGDGRDDVIVSASPTHSAGPGLLSFAGRSGATFAPAVYTALPGAVAAIGGGDANADGIDDVAVVHWESAASQWYLRWLLGQSSGTLQAIPGRMLPTVTTIGDLALFDFSGDGLDDVAVSGSRLIQTFVTSAAAPSVAGPVFNVVERSSTRLCAGDIDADGDADLIGVSTTGTSTLNIFRIRNLGGGSLAQLSTLTTTGADALAYLGDWNGDGSNDLFLREPRYGTYVQFRNDGSGGFAIELLQSTYLPATAGVGILDLNRDGHADFVDGQLLYFGDGTFRPTLETRPFDRTQPVDWEGDGDLDVPYLLGVQKNDGRGRFELETPSLPSTPTGTAYGYPFVIDDFDGDGLREALVAYFVVSTGGMPRPPLFIEMRLLHDDGAGAYRDAGACSSTLIQVHPITVDADADGDLDVLTEVGVWLNDGAHYFTFTSAPNGNFWPSEKGDVDGDGDLDVLALLSGGTQSIALLRCLSNGTFHREVLNPPSLTIGAIAKLADCDDDGDLDIVVDRGANPTDLVFYANSGGTFSQSAVVQLPTTQRLRSLAVADLDGDGRSDLALGFNARILVLPRTGPGFAYAPPQWYLSYGLPSFSGDLDQDGDLDLVGSGVTWNTRFDGPRAGSTRQYGRGLAGSAGRVPVLGGTGPLRVGRASSLRIRAALGGAPGVLLLGAAETSFADFAGIAGLTLYTTPTYGSAAFTAGGVGGLAGSGALDLPWLVPHGVGGTVFYAQALFLDGGATHGISATNGIERSIGF